MKSLLRAILFLTWIMSSAAPAFAEERSGSLYWAPPSVTVGGDKIDVLLNVIFWLTLAAFILTQAVYIFYLVRYRRRPGHKAHYSHGNNTMEFWWTIIPTAIVSAMNLMTDRFSRRRLLAIIAGLDARTRWMKNPIPTPTSRA